MLDTMLDTMLVQVFTLGVMTCVVFYWYLTRNFGYWKKQGAPYESPSPFFGNVKDVYLVRKSVGQYLGDLYKRCGKSPFLGFFSLDQPAILIKDPDLVKLVLVKDFQHFTDHNFSCDKATDPLFERTMFASKGEKWRHLRYKLSPSFTSGKVKTMFNHVVQAGEVLKEYIEKSVKMGEPLEIKDATARFTTDVIATCAFGIDCNTLKQPDAEFRVKGREMFTFSLFRSVKFVFAFLNPLVLKRMKWRIVNDSYYSFVRRAIGGAMEHRVATDTRRNDFIDLLLDIKKKKDDVGDDIPLEQDDYFAQAFAFLIAGSETSSTTMTFCLYEMALNRDIQTRLREEINSVIEKHGGKLTYEAVQEMTYLDRVVAETLRMYPLLPFLDRTCVRDYVIPDSKVTIKKGMGVYISLLGLHYDPELYQDPGKFDPERFTEENKRERHNYAYIPFGEGPRICIGMRFGLMNTKVGIIEFLAHNEVSPCKDTPIPIVIDPKSFLLTANVGIPLTITPVL